MIPEYVKQAARKYYDLTNKAEIERCGGNGDAAEDYLYRAARYERQIEDAGYEPWDVVEALGLGKTV